MTMTMLVHILLGAYFTVLLICWGMIVFMLSAIRKLLTERAAVEHWSAPVLPVSGTPANSDRRHWPSGPTMGASRPTDLF